MNDCKCNTQDTDSCWCHTCTDNNKTYNVKEQITSIIIKENSKIQTNKQNCNIDISKAIWRIPLKIIKIEI